MKKIIAAVAVSGFMMSGIFATLGAQAAATPAAQAAGKTTNDGVFTAEQAKAGEALYKEQCAACHGDNLEGSGPMPPLAGNDFLSNWKGKSVGELFEKTHTTMPATAPGTLTVEQSAQIVAYMLSVGKFPAGTVALDTKMEPLLQIKIDAPKP